MSYEELWLKVKNYSLNNKLKVFFLFSFISIFVNLYLKLMVAKNYIGLHGKYLFEGPDPYILFRYVVYYLEHGSLMLNDAMRYVPLGYNPITEFSFITILLANLYKFFNFFIPHNLETFLFFYPVVAYGLVALIFFLILREIFDMKYYLLAIFLFAFEILGFLRVKPGLADKEALSLIFFFLSIYLFLLVILNEKKDFKHLFLFTLGASISVVMSNMLWGGGQILLPFFGLLLFLFVLLNRLNKTLYYHFLLLFASLSLVLFFLRPDRFPLNYFFSFSTGVIFTFSILYATIYFVFTHKYKVSLFQKYIDKFPPSIFYLILSIVFSILLFSIFFGFSKVLDLIQSFYYEAYNPFFGTSRWARTVNESRPVQLSQIYYFFGKLPILVSFFGLFSWVFYTLKKITLNVYKPMAVFAIFSFLFFGSKYGGSLFLSKNSTFYWILSLIFLIGALIYGIYLSFSQKNIYEKIKNVDVRDIFLFSLFLIFSIFSVFIMRLVFFLAFIFIIFFAYGLITLFEILFKFEKPFLRYFGIFLILLILFSPSISSIPSLQGGGYVIESYNKHVSISNSGLPISLDFQNTMFWMKDNTPPDAVFASWWDYGYWIQALGERATISDGGNDRGAINLLTARYLLTSMNDTETLEFLYANNVTHIFISESDLSKFYAISSIGSDGNYDRFSQPIPYNVAGANPQGDGSLVYSFSTNVPLGSDIIVNNVNYLKRKSGISKVNIILNKDSNGNVIISSQPEGLLTDGFKRDNVKLKCVYLGGKFSIFENYDVDGCFFVVPDFITTRDQPVQAPSLVRGIYLERKIMDNFIGKYYLSNIESPYFEEVYRIPNNIQGELYFDGGLVKGPNKIWKVNYPKDIKDNPSYRDTQLPDPSYDIFDPAYA